MIPPQGRRAANRDLPRRAARLGLLMLLPVLAATAGCGGPGVVDVDQGRARGVLVEALDAWQRRESIEDFARAHPDVVINDPDWLGGRTLEGYEFVDEKPLDASLFCTVRLKFAESAGKSAAERTVTYIIGTTGRVAITRDISSAV